MFDTNRFVKSLVFSAVLGFASFLLSAHPLSWVLAIGVFYYDFMVRDSRSTRK